MCGNAKDLQLGANERISQQKLEATNTEHWWTSATFGGRLESLGATCDWKCYWSVSGNVGSERVSVQRVDTLYTACE